MALRRRPALAKGAELATLLDDSAADVLTNMTFPAQHRAKLHSTNPLERLNDEIKHRTEVVGIFPNGAAVPSASHPFLLRRRGPLVSSARYMTLETISAWSDDLLVNLPLAAASRPAPPGVVAISHQRHHVRGHDQFAGRRLQL